ncbi:dolichol-phosphate mannosyltransferase [Clostridium sp. CAG:609]|jgi:dolichyl-phosphate beta-D-mannosyltransferase|nr:dolichol-phosphate mannosyltransferase [Clostridium sp. CAG:609]
MKKLFSKYQTIITYILFSSLSFIVDIVSFSSILFFLKDKIMISSYLARTISSIFNYIVNKNIVFKNNEKKNLKSMIMYFLLVIVNITISGTLVKKIYFFIHYNATFIKIVIDSLIFIINYFLQKYVIFKK